MKEVSHGSRAEEQRCRRARQREAGTCVHTGSRGRSGKWKPPPKFDRGTFVAVDGEGFSEGPERVAVAPSSGREYRYRDHYYALLSASDGSEACSENGRLSAKQCLDFLLDIMQRDRDAFLVAFGATYDMTHMLAFDLSASEIDALLHGYGTPWGRKSVDVTLTGPDASGQEVAHDYRLEYRPRKALTVWRWPHGADKYRERTKRDGTVAWEMTKHAHAILYDSWGFFQGTFVKALETWLPGDPAAEEIAAMKARRASFERSEIDTVRRYNAQELRCFASIMNRLREAIRPMGITVRSWDGAGAIAAALLKKHGVKDHMAPSPPEVFEACRHAYSGGHIEAMKLGYSAGAPVWQYDINSAYPYHFASLPSLAGGTWSHTGQPAGPFPLALPGLDSGPAADPLGDPPPGFTLVRLVFRFRPGSPFYPLFYREPNGSILYPERGHGWYWYPEFDAARDFARRFRAIEFRVMEWYHYTPATDAKPFDWVPALYRQRQAIVEQSRLTKIPNGAEKAMKLGYNSCYGKAAQQVGARMGDDGVIRPSYFQLEWAGFVTASCRSQLMRAAMQRPGAVISLATDAIFSTERLDLPCPREKTLGAWEETEWQGMTIAMPGVYWLHDGPVTRHYSRGFDKSAMEDAAVVHAAWARGQGRIAIRSGRMVTLGTALMSETFWALRGCFTETERDLVLNGGNSKRCPVSLGAARPHTGLVSTRPRDLMEDYDAPLEGLLSEPYPIEWLKWEDMREGDVSAELTDADRSFFFDHEAMLLA